MTDPALTPDQENDALAAEYVLGLLDEDDLRAARQRVGSDVEFAALVLAWQERLAGFADELTPVMAPARARLHIQRSLGHIAEPLSDMPQIRASRGRGAGGGRGGWMGWLLGAVVAGAVALGVILLPQDGADYAADLVSDPAGLRVETRLDGRDLRIQVAQGGAVDGRDLELWWIDGDAAPVSLGVLPRSGDLTVALPAGLEARDGVQLALSDEPLGGSPTGQPTGEVVAASPLTLL